VKNDIRWEKNETERCDGDKGTKGYRNKRTGVRQFIEIEGNRRRRWIEE
jgi:hypothetical protein